MPHDQVTPVEEPNTPAMIWWKRILQVSANTVPTSIGGILVAMLASIAWNVWTLPDIIKANRKEAEAERARYHAEFKAEQEKSEAALLDDNLRESGPRRWRGRKVRGDLPPPRSHRQRRGLTISPSSSKKEEKDARHAT